MQLLSRFQKAKSDQKVNVASYDVRRFSVGTKLQVGLCCLDSGHVAAQCSIIYKIVY